MAEKWAIVSRQNHPQPNTVNMDTQIKVEAIFDSHGTAYDRLDEHYNRIKASFLDRHGWAAEHARIHDDMSNRREILKMKDIRQGENKFFIEVWIENAEYIKDDA